MSAAALPSIPSDYSIPSLQQAAAGLSATASDAAAAAGATASAAPAALQLQLQLLQGQLEELLQPGHSFEPHWGTHAVMGVLEQVAAALGRLLDIPAAAAAAVLPGKSRSRE